MQFQADNGGISVKATKPEIKKLQAAGQVAAMMACVKGPWQEDATEAGEVLERLVGHLTPQEKPDDEESASRK
jgi:hypothetical protein